MWVWPVGSAFYYIYMYILIKAVTPKKKFIVSPFRSKFEAKQVGGWNNIMNGE